MGPILRELDPSGHAAATAPAWRRLREEYRRSLKPRELEELADLVLCRPPAFLIARALRPTRVSPDAVSAAAVLWAVGVAALYWQGDRRLALLGAAAFYLWNVLDCVDGQLARLRGGGSPIGHMVDQVADVLSVAAVWCGLATHLTVSRPGERNWWLLCVVTGVIHGVECSVLEAWRSEWASRALGARRGAHQDLAEAARIAAEWRTEGSHLLGRLILRAYIALHRFQHLYARPSDEPVPSEADRERFARHHRRTLRLATWLGPTTQMCVLIGCTALGRVDAYLWAVLFVGVPWMLVVAIAGRVAGRAERRERDAGREPVTRAGA